MIIYPKPTTKMMSLEDMQKERELEAKIVYLLQTSISTYTIPELAKKLNACENEIASALYSLCLVKLPRILIIGEDGEVYFKKSIELSKYEHLPEFNSEMRFYHLWTR